MENEGKLYRRIYELIGSDEDGEIYPRSALELEIEKVLDEVKQEFPTMQTCHDELVSEGYDSLRMAMDGNKTIEERLAKRRQEWFEKQFGILEKKSNGTET